MPPSTDSSCPVTKAESSLARKSTARATSSGEPNRPSGSCSDTRFAKPATGVRVPSQFASSARRPHALAVSGGVF